jgi:serine/threonine protein phosphatase PrpC
MLQVATTVTTLASPKGNTIGRCATGQRGLATATPSAREMLAATYAALDVAPRASAIIGATAANAYYHADTHVAGRLVLTTASVGGTHAAPCSAGRLLRFGVEHRVGDQAERQRIGGANGFCPANRVNGALKVSRPLGDHSFKSLVLYTSGLCRDLGAAGNLQKCAKAALECRDTSHRWLSERTCDRPSCHTAALGNSFHLNHFYRKSLNKVSIVKGVFEDLVTRRALLCMIGYDS